MSDREAMKLRSANDLEAFYRLTGEGGMDAQAADELLHQHAEIEALKAENERLREALQWIASRCPTQFVDLQPHRIHLEAAHDAGACARAALQEVPR